MARSKNSLVFSTAIITYPSNYDGLLSIKLIIDKFESIINPTTKVVIAREDPDEEIQRIHYHLYWDDSVRKDVTTKYFDIKLPEPVIVFIKENGNRDYQTYNEICSSLGIDTYEEMAPKLDSYVKKNEYVNWDYLEYAHPNIQLKKEYGDKYFMLRYVLKQKLLSELKANFDVEEELKYLEENAIDLCKKANELTEQELLKEINVKSIDELISLLKRYKERKLRKEKNKLKSKSTGSSINKTNKYDEECDEFLRWLREQILKNKLTKNEILKEIQKNESYWFIYSKNYINYNKLVNDMFKGKPPSKPTKHYEFKFWVPNELYDYLMWLDHWVECWYTGKPLEHRPKGLCLIGPSRTGKTTLLATLGDFSYIKNVWNIDNWESATAFTIMDDMDAVEEGKGLSFCWFKPFFGAQDAITVTDKFKPKVDIWNGKPLIWINNYDLQETFKSSVAQDYIHKNMVIVYIKKPLNVEPVGMEVFKYKEFDPKCTWYYKNIVMGEINLNKKNNEIKFIDETEKTIEKCQEQYDESEPLNERKKRLLEEETGRPPKRSRRQD